MEPDFSGWATKAGLKCSDGLTILPDAFKHQNSVQVPLVYQHGHTDVESILGHAVLTNKPEGVWFDAYLNDTPKAKHAKTSVQHGDITMVSIWANELVKKASRVVHGMIREVSLVLSGANPGALIDPVSIRHSDDDVETLDDEAIIYTGLPVVHSNGGADDDGGTDDGGTDDGLDDEDLERIYGTMNDEQRALVHSVMEHADGGGGGGDLTIQDVYDSMTEEQQAVVHYLIGQAVADAGGGDSAQQGNLGGDHLGGTDQGNSDTSKGQEVKHNVFEQDSDGNKNGGHVLSHSDVKAIVEDAKKNGSLKAAVEAYAEEHLEHGIQDIDILFPEAKAIETTPELFGRRTEWVQKLMSGVRKSPFSRIKTMSADLTVQEARAKGYIKGTLKKEEFFRVSKRITTPTTIYKKQKLDRDDMVDITDFDVVAWLKGEMRLMLDEEVARAILVGDGRAVDDEDKISEDNIRPVASDHELFTTTVYVNIDDANSSLTEVVDEIILNRQYLRGSGLPILFTTETYIGRFMTLRDQVGRRLYKDLAELASELRVSDIVPVEILEEYPDIVGIMFNPTDYVVGADRGGEVNLFDDFDIDYNQYKYLIETRASGALVKLKAAIVIRKVPAAAALVAPADPVFDPVANTVTIVDTAGVVYRNADTDAVMTAAGSPYAVVDGTTLNVHADPAAGRYFENTANDDWSFTNPA